MTIERTRHITIVFGIDGLCWEYLNPLLESGRLPNLSRLIQGGTRGILKSTKPPISPLAWSSFLTGRNPQNHGVLDWWHAEDDKLRFRPSNALDRKCSHFWDELNASGLRVGVQNIPLTYPAPALDGFYVAGFDSPEGGRNGVFPGDVRESIQKFFGTQFPVLPGFSMISEGRSQEFKEQYLIFNNRQTDLALELIERFDIDVLAINYQTVDHFSHKMENFSDLEEALVNIDGNLGRFVTAYPRTNFIILSDHGSVRTKGAFLILDWLQEMGYMKLRPVEKRRRCTNVILSDYFQERLNWRGNAEKVVRLLLKYALAFLPDTIWEKAITRLDKDKRLQIYCPPELVDLKRSKITFCSAGISGFYVNPRLHGSEYETTCSELIEDLRRLIESESGKPIFGSVARAKEVNGDRCIGQGPDVLAWGNHEFHVTSVCRAAGVPADDPSAYYVLDDPDYFGSHTEDGIYIFSGSGFQTLGASEDLHIVDIPATMLALYDIPTPDGFDGNAANACLSENRLKAGRASTPCKKTPGKVRQELSTAEEEEEIKDKLKSLGYM